MIFVSVGTHEAPFDRLLHAVDDLELEEQIVVQHGPSRVRSDRALEAESLSFDEVVGYIREARAVVMHAGVGSMMIALTNGKRPIVMPRLRRFGEHVDDHQLELARRLEANGLVTVVDGPEALAKALDGDSEPAGQIKDAPWLGDDLGEYLAQHIGAAAPAPSQT